jgi:catechol 2,3-dioxygenase-like lactoylglutathione lyase family enzyme
MSNTLQITPFMHVADADAAVAFFTDILGFAALFRMPGYAYLEREGAGLRILESEEGMAPKPHGGFAYYIDVLDVDLVHAELWPKLETLPAGHVIGPIDQTYGQRELMIRAPDGNTFVFGAAIKSK